MYKRKFHMFIQGNLWKYRLDFMWFSDFERSKEFIEFTMMFIFVFFCELLKTISVNHWRSWVEFVSSSWYFKYSIIFDSSSSFFNRKEKLPCIWCMTYYAYTVYILIRHILTIYNWCRYIEKVIMRFVISLRRRYTDDF